MKKNSFIFSVISLVLILATLTTGCNSKEVVAVEKFEKTNIDRMNSRLNSLKELQKLLKNEYAATCLDIKALYGLDLF